MKIKYSRFADFLEFFKKTGKILLIGIYFFVLFFIFFTLNFENFTIFPQKRIALAATEFVSKIKENCAEEPDFCYTSLSAWEESYGGIDFGACALGDLVCADKIAVAKIEGNWTKPDTSAVSINGWKTDSVHYIKIYTSPEARHKGYLKSNGVYSGYVLKNSSGSSIRSYEEYVKIDGLLIENFSTGAYDSGFRLSVNNDKSENVVSNTIIKRDLGGASVGGAISKDYYFGRYKVINSIAQVDSVAAYGIKGAGASNYSEIYNTVVYGSGTKTGILNALAKNIIVANFASSFSGSSGDSNCATDSTAPGGNSLLNKTLSQISFVSVSSENENFHLNSNSICADKGINLSSIFNNDIDGEIRSALLWDIGADEISSNIVIPPDDIEVPVLYSGSPSGILPLGTNSVTLSVSTNENAVCKYSDIPNLTYPQMVNLFSETGGTVHSKMITGYADGNSYNYYIRCVDEAGNANLSDFVISFSVDKEIGAADTLAPSIPSNLTAEALSSSEINISWSASIDNIGVAGYKVYRNNIEIGNTKAFSFLDSGLTADTNYSYAVSAYDAAGNNSIRSSSVFVTTKSVEIIPIDKGGVYYMSAVGSDLNSGLESFPFKTFKHAFTKMKSGDTLIVKDGTYDQRLGEWKWLNSVKVPTSIPPSGTPEKYTIVRGQNVRAIVNSIKMVGASYVRIEGFKSLGKIDTDNSDHIIYKKIAAKGGISTTLSSYITKEDVWSWNDNRYTIHNFKSSHITDNRVIARLDDLGKPALLPVGAISHYLTNNSVIANALLFDVSGTFSQPYDLVYSSNPKSGNNQLWGVIGFNAETQLGGLYPADGGGNNYEINNSVIWGTSKRCIRFNALAPIRIKNNTCGENGGESIVSKNASLEVQNNIFYKNGGGILGGIISCDNNVFYLSGSIPAGCKNSIAENPQIKWLPKSPIAGKGANVLKKYNVSEAGGVLKVSETTQNLWPWPYEDLIKADMCEGITKGWCGTNKTLTQYIWEYLGNPIPAEIYGGAGDTKDTEAPTVPKNLTTIAVSDSEINLSWSASADNIGVSGYKIFRNGAQIALVSSLSYSDIGLFPATTYSYAASAYDAAGNNSVNSVLVSAKTKDSIIIPPVLTECADALILCVDDTPGINQEYSTIQAAANAVKPGSTVVVHEGNYTGFEISVSGNSSSPIIFKASGNAVINKSGAAGDGARIQNASYIKIEGFKIENPLQRCIAARGATAETPMRGIVIQNNICNNAGWEGFYLSQTAGAMILNNIISGSGTLRIERNHGIYLANSGSDNSIIRGNTISGSKGTGSEGVHINGDLSVGGDGLIKNVIIENNFIHNNAANGISLDGVQDSLVQNNVIYKNGRHALRAYKGDGAFGPKNLKAVNNTFIAGVSGWAIKISEDLGGHTIFNNILLSKGSGSISLNNSSFVSNNNILSNKFSLNNELNILDLISWQKSGYDLNSFISEEFDLFIDSLNSDYSLKDTSKAVNAGVNSINLISAPNTDIKGILRPQGKDFDIGAYENQIIDLFSIIPKSADTIAAEKEILVPAGFFKRNLFLGTAGEDIKKLQKILNFNKDTQVAEFGPGSPGNETNYFGIKTKTAVAKFQEKFKDEILVPARLSKATGYFGRLTIKKMEEIYGLRTKPR